MMLLFTPHQALCCLVTEDICSVGIAASPLPKATSNGLAAITVRARRV